MPTVTKHSLSEAPELDRMLNKQCQKTPNMKPPSHIKGELQHRNRLQTVSWKKQYWGFNQLYSRGTSHLILLQFQIMNTYSIRINNEYREDQAHTTRVNWSRQFFSFFLTEASIALRFLVTEEMIVPIRQNKCADLSEALSFDYILRSDSCSSSMYFSFQGNWYTFKRSNRAIFSSLLKRSQL